MRIATPKPRTTYPVYVVDDLTGSRRTIEVPRTRGEILEGLLPLVFDPDDSPTKTLACVHVREGSLTVHVYNPDALAEEVFGEARATFHRIFDFFYGGDNDGDGGIKAWSP